MKYIKLLPILFCCFLLTSCLDTVEELKINDNGTGNLELRMDMSKMVEMLKGFMPAEEMEKNGMDKAIDTVIEMKSILDTAQNVSAEKKALFRDGKMHMNMDMQKEVMKMEMNYPFTSYDNLNKMYAMMQNGEGGLSDALKSMPGKGLGDTEGGGDTEQKMPGQINNVFDVVVKKGLYSKTLNKERFQKQMADPKMEEMKSMMGMAGDMNYTTIINLPKPAKTVSNPNATLSADKKTVTLKANLADVFDKPETMELKIEY